MADVYIDFRLRSTTMGNISGPAVIIRLIIILDLFIDYYRKRKYNIKKRYKRNYNIYEIIVWWLLPQEATLYRRIKCN